MLQQAYFATSFLLTVGWVVSRVPIFYDAYTAHVQKQADDMWLLEKCMDADFFAKMRQHTDVCDQVRIQYNRPALLVGVERCFPEELSGFFLGIMPGWAWYQLFKVVLVCIALGVAVAPSILLPRWRAKQQEKTINELHTIMTQMYKGNKAV